ncbi:DsbE family thiol:disulfide interchange protein [Devosia faecipullorum]|uniref:DsbE family thiol:disulfide interchange protein n=1 Tax=Devosia faecipullorum TaxID=2755039 RepID=UPI00187B1A0E|nr:DsbE family thiol:disulfide interchange protein [Devosia faecipullorum]MBE7732658.1 DsbE family thiol:disulfide interchange protein [Devosia faecipullorum]
MRYLFFVLPLLALAALVAVFAFSIDRDSSLVRSALIDKKVPQFTLAPVEGLGVPGFGDADFSGEPVIVNVFASWCVPCRDEHPLLEKLKADTALRLFGINHSDAPENARAFLAELGNPYDAVGADRNRRVSIDWGVYGVPETFLVNKEGVIIYKHVGPLTQNAIDTELKPAIDRLKS